MEPGEEGRPVLWGRGSALETGSLGTKSFLTPSRTTEGVP